MRSWLSSSTGESWTPGGSSTGSPPDPAKTPPRSAGASCVSAGPFLSFPHLFIAAMGALGEPVEPYPDVPAPADEIA